jgi:two-component system, response regulator YesN
MNELNQSKNERLKAVLKVLDSQFLRPEFTVREWANQLNISASYLSKILRDYRGNAALWHLSDKRLQHACSLLMQKDTPIIDVAEASGYTDNNYFSRIFKRKFKKTPTEWREAYTKNGGLLP